MLKVNGQRKQRRPNQTWRRQAKDNVKRIGLEEAANRTIWSESDR